MLFGVCLHIYDVMGMGGGLVNSILFVYFFLISIGTLNNEPNTKKKTPFSFIVEICYEKWFYWIITENMTCGVWYGLLEVEKKNELFCVCRWLTFFLFAYNFFLFFSSILFYLNELLDRCCKLSHKNEVNNGGQLKYIFWPFHFLRNSKSVGEVVWSKIFFCNEYIHLLLSIVMSINSKLPGYCIKVKGKEIFFGYFRPINRLIV